MKCKQPNQPDQPGLPSQPAMEQPRKAALIAIKNEADTKKGNRIEKRKFPSDFPVRIAIISALKLDPSLKKEEARIFVQDFFSYKCLLPGQFEFLIVKLGPASSTELSNFPVIVGCSRSFPQKSLCKGE